MRTRLPGVGPGIVGVLVLAAALLGPLPSEVRASPAPNEPPRSAGAVEVRAIDAATGEPVAWANLVRLDAPGGWFAGEDGVFRIDDLEPGPLRVRVVHVSYESSPEIDLTVEPGTTARRTVLLAGRSLEMERIEVRADRRIEMRQAASGARTIAAKDAVALPNPSDDMFQMVRVLPGVAAADLGSEFHLRGGGLEETLVRIDGMELRNLFHGRDFGGITSVLPFGVVRRMDVYPGGFPARYGGRLSGAIDIGLRSEGEPGFHGLIGADAVSARGRAELHGERASLMVSAREGYLDRVLDSLQDRAVIQPAYRDLLVRGVHRPSASRSISLNYLRSEDHLLYEDGIDLHFVDADYVDHYLWSTASFTPTDRLRFRTTLHGATSRQLRRVEETGRDDHRQNRSGGRAELSWVAPGSHLLRLGAETEREWGTYELGGTGVVRIAADGSVEQLPTFADAGDFARRRTSLYLEDSWKPTARLAIDAGGRVSHDTDSEERTFDPRTSAALELPGGLTLRGAWGLYSQAPVRELGGSSELRVISDRPERAEHLLAGIEKRFGLTRLGLDAYEKRFDQLDGVVTRTIDGFLEHHVITHGRARGVELFLARRGEITQWWVAYAMGRSKWGNDRLTFSRDFDRLHSFTLTHTYRIGQGWDLGTTWSWHTGNPYTEQRWSQDPATDEWVLDEGFPYGERFPDYQRLDVRVRKRFEFDGWNLAVYAEGLNLTNHDNVLFYSWTFRERAGERVPERITRTGVPGVPSVGMEVRF